MILTIPLRSDKLQLPLSEALAEWTGPLRPSANEDAPPMVGHAKTFGKVLSQLTQTLDALEDYESVSPIIGAPSQKKDREPTRKAYVDLMYRLAEYYDYLQGIPKALDIQKGHARTIFTSKLNKYRDKAAFICNRIKHNQQDLVSVKCNPTDGGEEIHGYSLYRVSEAGVSEPNRNFHKRAEALSFNLGLREDICSLLLADSAAAAMCRAVNPSVRTSELPQPFEPDALVSQIRRVTRRSEVGMPLERSAKIWTIRLEFGHVAVGLQLRSLPPKMRGAKIEVQFPGDGYTRSFALPDWKAMGSARGNPWKRP